jgi:dTMP kinase
MSLFITFEGPEGSGKSTQIKLLCTYLLAQNYPVVQTREPGGTPIGDQVRKVLLSPEHAEMLPITEFLLFSASRAQLVSQFIRPHLAAGRTVLCDRFADSSLAYQGYAHGLELAMLRQISQFATGGLAPDCTIYFDLDVRAGLQRKQQATVPLDRLDAQSIEFHERVRRGYLAMAAQEPERWFVVNAEANVNTVQLTVRQRVEGLIAGQATRA